MKVEYLLHMGGQLLKGRVLDSRSEGLPVGASPAALHCVPEQEALIPV